MDVLVGAGPTGLALAARAVAHGTAVRVVDRTPTAAYESRALLLQPRTLEVLAGLRVTDELLARGSRTVRLALHAGRRVVVVPLFASQAETETVLAAYLEHPGVEVERGTELVGLEQGAEEIHCRLVGADGEKTVTARYVV